MTVNISTRSVSVRGWKKQQDPEADSEDLRVRSGTHLASVPFNRLSLSLISASEAGKDSSSDCRPDETGDERPADSCCCAPPEPIKSLSEMDADPKPKT